LNQPVLREGGVIIAVCPSAGYIDERLYPSYREVIDLYGRYHSAASLASHEDDVGNRPDFLHRYRFGYRYPPLHPFWLFYENDYALSHASKVIMAGTTNPGAFHTLDITPATTFEHAWSMAARVVGKDPVTVVAPSFWSRRVFKIDVQA
jgi:lactate racemase